VATRQPDVIEIVESDRELRADQWIGRRLQFSGDTIRLETVDACSHVIDIIAPSRDHWVPFDCMAWNPCTRQ
jgi:hypothetical protein